MHLAYLHYVDAEGTALNHVRQFAEAARSLGHRVDVCAMNHESSELSGPRPAQILARLRRTLKRPLRRYLHEPKLLARNARNVFREHKLLRAIHPDLLLVRLDLLTASCVPVARRLGLPLVLECNASADEARRYADQYLHLPKVPEWLEAWQLRQADYVTTVSSALKSYLVERYRLPEGKVAAVPNGTDVRLFRPDAAGDPQIPKIFETAPVVGFVGSFQKWHGADLLGEMATRIADVRPSVRFLFVGDGPEAETVRRMTAPLGDRVLITGAVPHDRVPGLVASFDIAVMPESNWYGSPLKVVEWMAAGKAVIAPRYGPLEEIIEDGVEGILFPPRDREALCQAVLRMVDHPDLRRDLGARASARAHSSLSWEDNARRVMAVCQQALDRHRSHDGQKPARSAPPPRDV